MKTTNESPAPTKTEQLVFIENDKPITTSRLIAKTFGKQHRHVLRDIQNLNCSEKFTQSNFGLSTYKDKSGKENKEFHVTKDGFTMLAFGYTGEKAMNFKELYIERFNFMEAEFRKKPETKELTSNASEWKEETLITVKMGQYTNRIYIVNGVIYAQLAPIAKYLGFLSGGTHLIDRMGRENCRQVLAGKWFINVNAYDRLLNLATHNIESSAMSSIYKDVYKVGRPMDDYIYHYTASQMLEIYETIMKPPVNKDKVIDQLRKGKI